MKKICRTCEKELLATTEYFYKQKNSKDGLTGECKQCTVERAKKNRAKKKEQEPEWYEKVKEKERNKMAENRKDPEYRKLDIQRKRQFYKDNKEKIHKKWKRYYQENRDYLIIREEKRRSKVKKLISNFSKEDWEECREHFNNECAYCGKESNKLTQDHVIPVAKGGHYVKSNIIPACKSCNFSKRDKDIEKWFKSHEFYNEERLKKIYEWIGKEDEEFQQIAFL